MIRVLSEVTLEPNLSRAERKEQVQRPGDRGLLTEFEKRPGDRPPEDSAGLPLANRKVGVPAPPHHVA